MRAESPRCDSPGNGLQVCSRGLKGRNKVFAPFPPAVPPIQGGADLLGDLHLGLRALRFTPGCHITGFQPAAAAILAAVEGGILPPGTVILSEELIAELAREIRRAGRTPAATLETPKQAEGFRENSLTATSRPRFPPTVVGMIA